MVDGYDSEDSRLVACRGFRDVLVMASRRNADEWVDVPVVLVDPFPDRMSDGQEVRNVAGDTVTTAFGISHMVDKLEGSTNDNSIPATWSQTGPWSQGGS